MTADLSACDWSSTGADRYTGTVAAAIASYGLPIATQTALIAAFERREFTDTVVIDRDSIRGKAHEYDSDIKSMHFGSLGRTCGNVTRAGWADDHVEAALVVCSGDECIAIPAVCLNVFRITRRPEADRPGQPGMADGGVELGTPGAPPSVTIAGPSNPAAATPGVVDLVASSTTSSSGPAFTSFASSSYSVTYTECCVGCAVPAVAEPESYALILLGLAAVAVFRRGHSAQRAGQSPVAVDGGQGR